MYAGKKLPDIRKPSRGKISSHESRRRVFLLLFLNCWFSTTGPDAPSVPLRRPLEMHFDRLLWVSDIHPVSIRLPSFGDNLDQNSSHWQSPRKQRYKHKQKDFPAIA